MSKKKLIAIVLLCFGVLAVAVGIFYYINYQNSLKTISFDIRSGVTIDIYKKGIDKKVASLDKSGELKLVLGEYSAVPSGLDYDTSPVSFSVNEGTKVTIYPDYSSTYLSNLLSVERPSINKQINDTYTKVIAGFIIESSRLYKDGSWCAVTLIQKSSSEVYRLVLRKVDGAWSILTKPALVLSSPEYPNIPIEVLRGINET